MTDCAGGNAACLTCAPSRIEPSWRQSARVSRALRRCRSVWAPDSSWCSVPAPRRRRCKRLPAFRGNAADAPNTDTPPVRTSNSPFAVRSRSMTRSPPVFEMIRNLTPREPTVISSVGLLPRQCDLRYTTRITDAFACRSGKQVEES